MEGCEPCSTTLTDLSPDCIARVLAYLSITDMQNCLLSSKALHAAVHDERVWQAMCEESWGTYTDLHLWVIPAGTSPLRCRGLQPPSTYRALYYLLHRTAPVVGLWRLVGEGPTGALIAFSWSRDGIKGEELQYDSLEDELDCVPYRTVCPRRGLGVRLEVVDLDHAVIKDGPGSWGHLAIHRSPSVEAAASVALSQSSLPDGAGALGTSPVGSFEYEWLQFMSANVSSGRAKQRRRAAKSPGVPGASPGAVMHHLKRVQRPVPTAKHPLAGLWAAECGGPGIEVLHVAYDFSKSSARIAATKMTGNRLVPAGQQAWVALAAPLPQPWKPHDQQMVAHFQAKWEEEQEMLGGLQEWMLEEEEEGGQLEQGAAPAGGSWGGQPRPAAQRQVLAIHEGSMQVGDPGAAGGRRWVEGRLWVLGGGGLGFLAEDELFCMRRIDADVAAVFAAPLASSSP